MIYLELFLTFFMIGIVTFGGGYAMLPMIQEQVGMRWGELITEESLVNFVAVSESTPGPFAINMATYVGSTVGSQQGGVLMSVFGAFCATMGVVLPSFIVILIVAKFYLKFKNSKAVSGVMYGLRSAVVGLMAAALFGMLTTVFFHNVDVSWGNMLRPEFICSAVIFAVMTVLALKKLSPMIIIGISAAVGILCGYIFL